MEVLAFLLAGLRRPRPAFSHNQEPAVKPAPTTLQWYVTYRAPTTLQWYVTYSAPQLTGRKEYKEGPYHILVATLKVEALVNRGEVRDVRLEPAR